MESTRTNFDKNFAHKGKTQKNGNSKANRFRRSRQHTSTCPRTQRMHKPPSVQPLTHTQPPGPRAPGHTQPPGHTRPAHTPPAQRLWTKPPTRRVVHFPKEHIDIRFDDLLWFGQVKPWNRRREDNKFEYGIWITLPTDGFLVTHPDVSQVVPLARGAVV